MGRSTGNKEEMKDEGVKKRYFSELKSAVPQALKLKEYTLLEYLKENNQ